MRRAQIMDACDAQRLRAIKQPSLSKTPKDTQQKVSAVGGSLRHAEKSKPNQSHSS
eukprot:m.520002 g.520002  ORF g.520002 m.520002 type:complete len:56 (+) comp57492_c1_seq1:1361-1528(+)